MFCSKNYRWRLVCVSGDFDQYWVDIAFQLADFIGNTSFTKPNQKKKRPHCQLRLFSANLTKCKKLYEHKIQQQTNWTSSTDMQLNRNGIMRPWTKRGPKSKVSQYLVWPPGIKYCSALLIMECTRFASSCCEMLPHSSTKAPANSQTFLGGMTLALTRRSNKSQMCSMGLKSALHWPWQNIPV
jgi:hypothetical protein